MENLLEESFFVLISKKKMANGNNYLLNSVSLESYILLSFYYYYYLEIKVPFRPKELSKLVNFPVHFSGVGAALGKQILPSQLSHSITDKIVLRKCSQMKQSSEAGEKLTQKLQGQQLQELRKTLDRRA